MAEEGETNFVFFAKCERTVALRTVTVGGPDPGPDPGPDGRPGLSETASELCNTKSTQEKKNSQDKKPNEWWV